MLHKDDLVQAEARIKEASAAHLANIEHRLGQLIATTYEALKHIINHKVETLMAKLDDFISAQQAHNAAVADDLSAIGSSVSGLKQQISDLQTQLAGAGLSQAQSDALDALSASADVLQAQADALAGKQPPAPPAPEPAPAVA